MSEFMTIYYLCNCEEPHAIRTKNNDDHTCFFERALMKVSPPINDKDCINVNTINY